MKNKPRLPSDKEQRLLDTVRVRPIRDKERVRLMRLLKKHHYLGELQAVGEQIFYVAVGPNGGWRAIAVFCAAANHLRYRDRWIGWTDEQRRRRLALIANNARFLILPGYDVPNMGSRVMRLILERISADWQARYEHPLAMVETFVDPCLFQGTVYKASGWVEIGQTRGYGRVNRDYYEAHDRPKRLFVRELVRHARRGLQAEHLKPAWAGVEAKVSPRCRHRVREIRSLVEHFKQVPEYRSRIQSYPLYSLLAIVALAYLCEAPRGPKDLVKFARQMSRGQRRALGIRRNRRRAIPAPSLSTFARVLKAVDARAVESAVLAFQEQVRGPAPRDELVALDGKAAKHSGGQMLLNAVHVPSFYYRGSEPVPVDKTNEIPVARAMFERLDLVGQLVGLDAMHTQTETACRLVQNAGADYLFTVKDNQKGLRQRLRRRFTAASAAVSPPYAQHTDLGLDRRDESRPAGTSPDSNPVGHG